MIAESAIVIGSLTTVICGFIKLSAFNRRQKLIAETTHKAKEVVDYILQRQLKPGEQVYRLDLYERRAQLDPPAYYGAGRNIHFSVPVGGEIVYKDCPIWRGTRIKIEGVIDDHLGDFYPAKGSTLTTSEGNYRFAKKYLHGNSFTMPTGIVSAASIFKIDHHKVTSGQIYLYGRYVGKSFAVNAASTCIQELARQLTKTPYVGIGLIAGPTLAALGIYSNFL